MSRTLKVTGDYLSGVAVRNHAPWSYIIMPCALCVASRQQRSKNMTSFGFCDIQNNQGLGKGYVAPADNPYLDLDYSVYHKNLIQ